MAENEKNEFNETELEEMELEINDPVEEKTKQTEKKGKKAPTKKKPNFLVRMVRGIRRWFREMHSELKKVQWPTAKQTANNTVTVIICVIIIGVCIWVFDWLAAGGAKALIALAQS